MKYKITFEDIIEADSEEEAYDKMVEYCGDVYETEDVTAFNFEELRENLNFNT